MDVKSIFHCMSDAIQLMFDRISSRYDFLNRFLSLRRDVAWRRRACRMAGPANRILDLCGGTGDFLLSHRRLWGSAKTDVVGDFSRGMLQIAKAKSPGIHLVQLDALKIPLGSASMDLTLCGFGMRNLDHLDQGLSEVSRVLVKDGCFVVLEFFRPTNLWTRFFYGVLGALLIPIAGAIFSGRREAYEYLVRSVRRFVSVEEFSQQAKNAGFHTDAMIALDGGIAHLVVLRKEI